MAMASHDSITITVQDPPAPLENTADSSKEDEAGISQPSDIAQTRIPQIFEFLPKAGDHLLRTQARVIEKPYICRVPHLLREVNKRAYEPNVISIGPYHHGLDLERFKVTEALKLSCFLTIFKENNSVADKIVRSMQRLEARVRECYEEASDLDSKEFVEMMVYDGCFIVLLILGYADDDIFKAIGILREIEKDLLLLENQLPFFVLSELYRIIVPEEEGVHQLSHHVISYYRNCYLFHLFDNLLPDKEIKHLLHLVHSCHHPSASGIKQHQDFKRKAASKPTSQRKMKFIGNATELDDAGINFLGATIEKMKDQKPGIETEFDIMFTKDTKLLMIPTLNVYDGTERQFRNYIAYEQFIPCSEPIYFSDYVLFMDYLIDTSKDVQLLRKSGIIENGLGDDEAVAQMFNRLLDSVYCSSTDFYYAEIFGRMTKHCQRRRNRWKAALKKNISTLPGRTYHFLPRLSCSCLL
ncbi:hypothetical protein V6N13_090310 [Hibiscus sabdariffa]